MDFQLTEDQRAFADMAQSLFADYCSDDQLRAHDTSGAPYQQALWQQCVAAGLHGITVPEEHGGLGLGMTELMAVLEQQGRALALVPLWEQQLAAATLARFGCAALQPALAALMAGEIAAVSLAGLAQSRGCTLRLARRVDGWILQGSSPAVPLAAAARHALLVAQAEDGPRLVWLALDAAGITRTPGQSQHHQEIADLQFDGVALAGDAVLPTAAIAWLEPRAIAALASIQLGVTAEQLRRTVAYVSERKQFDRPIGSFQLVAGQMADGHIALEALRSSLWQLVYRLDAGLELRLRRQGRPVFRDDDPVLVEFEQLDLVTAGRSAQDETDGWILVCLAFVTVQPLQVEVHLPLIVRLELPDLQFHCNQPTQRPGVEQ